MSVFSKRDYELINLGVCIKQQAERLGIEHDGVPLEGVVVRIALRAGAVVAEEPEWEYGVEHVQVDGWVNRELHLNRQEALDDYATCGMNCTLMRRRKAGPWVPVKQEGAEQ